MAKAGNQSALKHGGEAASKALLSGKPFTGLAVETEKAVTADLDTQGRAALVERLAIRAQVCTELYWQAVTSAADRGDLAALDRYIARFGWLVGVAGRAWEAVKADRKHSGGKLAEVLAAYQNSPQDGQGGTE
jgi:hypothetical protein